MLLYTDWFGTFLLEGSDIVEKRLFPKSAEEIARRMHAVEQGSILQEERVLAAGIEGLEAVEQRLGQLGASVVDASPSLDPSAFGYSQQLLQGAMVALGELKVRETSPDMHMMQAVKAIDDLTETINLFTERFTEWCGYIMPSVPQETFDRCLPAFVDAGDASDLGRRLEDVGMDADVSSLGQEDLHALSSIARELSGMRGMRSTLEGYIEGQMASLAPNLRALAGPLVGARLITLAGGLKRLAKLPSSTVQVLGAETAFFMHLKEGTAPPKHGIIFQHPLVHGSPYWQRGKIARALAGKLSIAAKIDWSGGEDSSARLQADLDKRVKEIKDRCTRPPAKKRSQFKKGDGRRFKGGRGGRGRGGPGDRRKGRRGKGKR